MPPVKRVARASSYEQRVAIAHDADNRQERIAESITRDGFHPSFDRILSGIEEAPLTLIERHFREEFASDEFRDTLGAIRVNGVMLAIFIHRRFELAVSRVPRPLIIPVSFAEALSVFTPERAIRYWQRIFKLTDAQANELGENLNRFQQTAFALQQNGAMVDRLTTAVMERVAALYAETIRDGLQLTDFVSRARELLPNATDAQLETEYRTRLTTVYEGSRREQIAERANVFPFMQFIALLDTRTTWWICRPMGLAGPNGTGYIAATGDVIWDTWTPPCHYRCRSTISPISYREAQRLGILAADGRTKIARVGGNPNRPFGDPPRFATDELTSKIRRVEPQIGFGA